MNEKGSGKVAAPDVTGNSERGYPFKFTKKAIDDLKPPTKAKQVYYSDTEARYLRLSVGRSGNKSFVFYKKVEGVPRRLELGRYPDTSIEQARGKVGGLLSRLALGENPFDEGLKARAANTVEDLFNEYIERHAKIKCRTWEEMRRNFGRYVPISFRKRKAMQVTSTQARQLHSDLLKEKGLYTANRTVQLLRAVYNKAAKYGFFDGRNPFADVELAEEEQRERFLSDEEVKRLFSVLPLAEQDIQDFIYLSILTGARKANVLSMRFEDVDFGSWTWTIGSKETKTKKKYVIALGGREIEILNRRSEVVGGPFVFPGTGKTGHLVDPKKAWTTIRANARLGDCTIHDLRRSLAAALANANVNVALIKGAMNHKDVKTTLKHYALSSKDAERSAKQNVHSKWFGTGIMAQNA